MNIKYITISVAAVAVLFTACGGGGGGEDPKDNPPVESVAIQNGVKSFKTVAGDRKLVTMNIGKDVITDGEPNSEFKVVNVDNGATASFNKYGVLKFESSAPGTYKVVVNVKNSAGTSADQTFTFEVISKSDAGSIDKQLVLNTSRTNYTRDENTQYNVVDNDTGLQWIDNNDASSIANSTYATAKDKCTGEWRLPILNELLDVIDYNKPYMVDMLPEIFVHKDIYMWVEENNGKNYFVNTSLGMTQIDTAGQMLSYRCVKGDKYEENHLISTYIATGATYDYTTGLKWSKAKSVEGIEGAEQYCSQRLQEEDGWRLPTINELRSIVEDGSVADSVVGYSGGQHLTLISSTDSNNSGGAEENAQPMHYGLILFWDRSEPWVTRFYDSGDNAKYSTTCVKEFN